MTAKNDDYYHLGLTDSEVLQSREKNGVNLLTPPKRPSLWKLYLEKFEDPVVRVLLVAAVFSLIISIIENEYAETIGLPLLERNDYGLRPFVRTVAEDISGRCVKCYEMRLFEAARQAREGGFDSFTSSLFISPYQKHELMQEVAERAAVEYGVTFLYRDFRPYFRAGQERARELGFYMQKYCGCIFSEEERYLKASKILP